MTTPGFLDAILHNPADDTPRLILADYLDEHGEPERAHWLRMGAHEPLNTVRVWPGRELRYGFAGRPPVVIFNGPDWCESVFNRGFVSSITCAARAWLQHCQAILAQQPIETVQMGGLTLAIYPDAEGWHCRLTSDRRGPNEPPYQAGVWPTREAMIWNHPNWLTCIIEELRPVREIALEEVRRAYRQAAFR